MLCFHSNEGLQNQVTAASLDFSLRRGNTAAVLAASGFSRGFEAARGTAASMTDKNLLELHPERVMQQLEEEDRNQN